MARGGARNNTPTAIKMLTGNPGKRPLNLREPQPEIADLTPPDDLDDAGRQAWERNAPILQRMGVFTEADRETLMLYCDAYSQWRRSVVTLRKIAPVNEKYRSVAVTVEKARDQMRYLLTEMGMSPASRSRLSVAPKAEDVDPMEALLSGKAS